MPFLVPFQCRVCVCVCVCVICTQACWTDRSGAALQQSPCAIAWNNSNPIISCWSVMTDNTHNRIKLHMSVLVAYYCATSLTPLTSSLLGVKHRISLQWCWPTVRTNGHMQVWAGEGPCGTFAHQHGETWRNLTFFSPKSCIPGFENTQLNTQAWEKPLFWSHQKTCQTGSPAEKTC